MFLFIMSALKVLTTILIVIILCEGYVEKCLIGECKSIYECEHYHQILHKKFKSSEELQFLREATCGFINFVPKVCCHSLNDQGIPDNQYSTASTVEEFESFNVSTEPGPAVMSQKLTNGPLKHCQETISTSPPDPKSKCCGIERRSIDKIMGGDEVDIGQYPWLALIEYAKSRTPMCGGALISGNYVLTAAHCIVVDAYGRPISVILGEYDMSHDGPDCVLLEPGVEDCTTGAIRIGIAKLILHPGFNPAKSQRPNDIGLIKLRRMAPYNYFILPICLPSADLTASPPNNLTLYVAGFGATENSPITNIKMHVGLPFVNMTECQANYHVPGYNMELLKTQLCAGGEGGKDSCKGDSGGPLMYENGRTFELVGVVSMGPLNCGEDNIPGLYTKVFDYLDWIKLNMLP